MRQLSLWARRHVWLSRLLILGIYLLLNGTALLLAALLQALGFQIPVLLTYLACFAFLSGLALYPSRARRAAYPNFYGARKAADLVLASCTFFLIVAAALGTGSKGRLPQGVQAAYITPGPGERTGKIQPLKKWLQKKARPADTSLRAKLKAKILALKVAYRGATNGEKVALIILSILIAAGLIYLLLGLSCGIACSGSEGLAVVVLFLGTGLITFLLIKVIQRINRGPRQPQEVTG